ncbi:MAG: DUF1343 domain-containing protein [Bacteroidota bacterium]
MTDSTALSHRTQGIKQEALPVKIGAEVLMDSRLDSLKGKRVAIVANQTTRFLNGTHLVDSLLSRGINVVKVFAPEHGFRGTADAGEHVKDGVDQKTGLPIISLYGKSRKPSQAQLSGVDHVIFDIQDVGVRLYTYISTMSYVMETCAEMGLSIEVLDRPNPNGWYVDGPVMEDKYTSFVGFHAIPVVHGMTICEYAKMVENEASFRPEKAPKMVYTLCENYKHDMRWEETGWPWIPPSPNLGSVKSAYLYPALVWFERTPISLGRGTDTAFTIMGSPWFKPDMDFNQPNARQSNPLDMVRSINFTPKSLPGKSKYPKFENMSCAGYGFSSIPESPMLTCIHLFQRAYANYLYAHPSEPFFLKSFEKWVGNTDFKHQITEGVPANEIYDDWQNQVNEFKKIRAKYLLYP